MPAAGRYLLGTWLDPRDIPAGTVADLLEGLEPGPARDAITAIIGAARTDVAREARKREAARIVVAELARGRSKKDARERAATLVGVSPWTIRVSWDL